MKSPNFTTNELFIHFVGWGALIFAVYFGSVPLAICGAVQIYDAEMRYQTRIKYLDRREQMRRPA